MKKTLQTLLTAVAILFSITLATAQDRTISGKISDGNGGLPGVSVVAKGTTKGSQTDSEGKFSFSAPKGATTLVISSVGYVTQELAIPESGVLELTLAGSESSLDEGPFEMNYHLRAILFSDNVVSLMGDVFVFAHLRQHRSI